MKLEEYINNNREEFNDRKAPDFLWATIKPQLKKQPKSMHLNYWMAAASIIFLLGVGFYMGSVQKTEEVPIVSSVDEFDQYAKFISLKKQELTAIKQVDPRLYNQFNSDFKDLEHNFNVLKAELPDNPNQEEILGAMKNNLQWQLNLLDQQLSVIKKIKYNGNKKETI